MTLIPRRQSSPRAKATSLRLDFEAFLTHWHQPFLRIAAVQLDDPAAAHDVVLRSAHLIHRNWDVILSGPAPAQAAFQILSQTIADEQERHRPSPTALRAALAELEQRSTVQAHCVRLRHLTQLPYDDVATLLDLPAGMARSHTWAGLRFLATRLNEPTTTLQETTA